MHSLISFDIAYSKCNAYNNQCFVKETITIMSTWDLLLTREELAGEAKLRATDSITNKISLEELPIFINQGWEESRRLKHKVEVKKQKPIGDAFEDEVWTVFYKMGFSMLNKSHQFNLSYGEGTCTKQIDVIAMDDEVCLFIECKASSTIDRNKGWKTDLEAMCGQYNGLCNEIRHKYGPRKFKYIFATKNYIVGDADLDRIHQFNFIHFTEESIRYYNGLAQHLGCAAKYQLLGNIFSGQKIQGLNMVVPAVQGKMGNLTYYSFVIEPQKLLKIAYVLHRNNANNDLMPTYQRLIQKSRLTKIQEFVNKGGYFPNSLIISVDSKGKGLRFDLASNNDKFENSTSKLGILYLPQTYQSAYVIDGQHRLYGYSGSNYEGNNSIPVVAFVDLKKDVQLQLFMDINENQKSVSKQLRNTLNIDMLWNSSNYSDRIKALFLRIAEKLGEDNHSPLYKRVITGENIKTIDCCITTENIKLALSKTHFLNTYNKHNQIMSYGIFDKQDNDQTLDILYPFLSKCLSFIQSLCSKGWDAGSNGYITINNTIYALIRIIDDCSQIVCTKDNTLKDADTIYENIEDFLFNLSETLLSLSDESKLRIRQAKGAGGPVETYRIIQVALNQRFPDFINEDLSKHIEENCKNNNPAAGDLLTRLEVKLRDIIKEEYQPNEEEWIREYVPTKLSEQWVSYMAIAKHRGEDVCVWDLITFEAIKELAKHKSNWSTFYRSFLEIDGKSKLDTLSWLESMSQCKKMVENNRQIPTSQYKDIEEIANKFGILLE